MVCRFFLTVAVLVTAFSYQLRVVSEGLGRLVPIAKSTPAPIFRGYHLDIDDNVHACMIGNFGEWLNGLRNYPALLCHRSLIVNAQADAPVNRRLGKPAFWLTKQPVDLL